nr:hypothetical protein [uncultured archaeon]
MNVNDFTKYEKARILGARALQIAMNAPLLIKITPEDLEKIKYDALKIAEVELNSNVLPINVKKPFPERKEEALKRVKKVVVSDAKKEELEELEEKDIEAESEIMELANPSEEDDFESDGEVNEVE